MAIFRNGIKTDIDMLTFIDQIAVLEWRNVVRNIDGEIAAMFPLHLNRGHINKRIVPLGKFRRDYKPFLGRIDTSSLRSIQSNLDVVELVTMVYDSIYRVAILDYNTHGLKKRIIEEYYTSYLPIEHEVNWEVKLIPILENKGIDDISRSRQIKNLEVRLKLDRYTQNVFNNGAGVQDTQQIRILDLFNCAGEATTGLDANVLKIELGVGNNRDATMNLESIRTLLHILDIDNELIENIKVRYRDGENNKLDTIDLKNANKQYKDVILQNDPVTNPESEYIGNTIIELYGNYEGTVSRSYNEFISDMITVDLPGVQREPRQNNLVSINE